ncbi:MAG: hypothetical protein M1839_007536 [Geoglossum umbratile]|nr:MAG: hypothetical protein M1839_007536 [Geoglossum umbratile]
MDRGKGHNPPSYCRLHISPLNPSLLQVLLPPSVLPLAKNVSYHTLETFPEKNYGFVDLPVMEAGKVRRKLNGTIFKGTKVRVEEARPPKTLPDSTTGNDAAAIAEGDGSARPPKRRRREEGVIAGFEMPNGRKVQRGWTKPAPLITKSSAAKQKLQTQTSSYSTTSECLFRTTLPMNIASSNAPSLVASTKARMGERKMKDLAGRETVVHEFSSTTKFSSFLRDNTLPKTGKVVFEFVEGKGWVDDEGNVIEAIKEAEKSKEGERGDPDAEDSSQAAGSNLAVEIDSGTEGLGYDSESSEDSESGESSESDDSDLPSDSDSLCLTPGGERNKRVTGNSRDKNSTSQRDYLPPKKLSPTTSQPTSAGSVPSLSLTIPTTTTSPVSTVSGVPSLSIQIPTNNPRKEVHPLEAVFKHPSTMDTPIVKSSVECSTPFTFFGPDAGDFASSPTSAVQTPFSRRDIFYRGIRSAAPTPDTAAPWRRLPILWPNGIHGDDDDEVMEGEEGDTSETTGIPPRGDAVPPSVVEDSGPATATSPTSDGWDALPTLSDPSSLASLPRDEKVDEKGFEELFYESRGEMNRAWKRRRREMGKEKRKRENKGREPRAADA